MEERKSGLDCLKEEMRKRGCSKAQTESTTAAVVLDICTNSGHVYQDLAKAYGELSRVEDEIEQNKSMIRRYQDALNDVQERYLREREKTQRILDEVAKEMEDFNKEVSRLETEAARDAARLARFYVNNTNVDTKYDNTAFIIGLGAILAGGSVDAVEELKKINPALFERSPIPNTKKAGNRL